MICQLVGTNDTSKPSWQEVDKGSQQTYNKEKIWERKEGSDNINREEKKKRFHSKGYDHSTNKD